MYPGENEGLAAALAGVDIPDELQPAVRRHQASLASLIANLRSAGIGEDMVESSIHALVESYRAELTAAIGQLVDTRK
jgi:hypothetical protein